MARPLERPATRRGSALQILHHSDLPRKGRRYLVGDRLLESGNVPVDTVKAAEIPFLQEDAFFGQCRTEGMDRGDIGSGHALKSQNSGVERFAVVLAVERCRDRRLPRGHGAFGGVLRASRRGGRWTRGGGGSPRGG